MEIKILGEVYFLDDQTFFAQNGFDELLTVDVLLIESRGIKVSHCKTVETSTYIHGNLEKGNTAQTALREFMFSRRLTETATDLTYLCIISFCKPIKSLNCCNIGII